MTAKILETGLAAINLCHLKSLISLLDKLVFLQTNRMFWLRLSNIIVPKRYLFFKILQSGISIFFEIKLEPRYFWEYRGLP